MGVCKVSVFLINVVCREPSAAFKDASGISGRESDCGLRWKIKDGEMLHWVDLHPEEGMPWVNWGKQTMSVWLIPAPRLSNIKGAFCRKFLPRNRYLVVQWPVEMHEMQHFFSCHLFSSHGDFLTILEYNVCIQSWWGVTCAMLR